MEYTIKNGVIAITVKSMGAELVSLIDEKTGREYMWEADPRHWGGCAPILFPFVGGLKNGEYRYDGKTYKMQKHGFARRMEFALTGRTANSLWFTLTDTPETFHIYPFHFRLELGYELSEGCVKVRWRVINTDRKKLYFSIGGHPAFVCPPDKKGSRTECFIGFEGAESIVSSGICMQDGLASEEKKEYALLESLLPITEHLFDRDALVVENNQTHAVSLCGPDKRPYVKVEFDAPLFGVWSMPESDASFVCIEPW